MNLQRIYENLKKEYESRGVEIDEEKLRQMAWIKRDRMLFENASAASSSAAAAGAAGAGGGGGSGNRRSVTPPPPSQGFIFRVNTSLGNGNATFVIPTSGSYSYDYIATWTLVSDPSVTGSESGLTGTSTITFPSGGQYDIEITGLFPAMEFGKFSTDPTKVIGIIQWGSNQWQSMLRMFYSCYNLSLYLATDQPDLGEVTSMQSMFYNASLFNGDISGWDVSGVTNMSDMFSGAASFNRDLSGWCVSGISPQPLGFDFGATSWILPRPDWGSPCGS
jgi:surface protein